jgi:hypothetical protein
MKQDNMKAAEPLFDYISPSLEYQIKRLKIRPINKPIHRPSERDKIAQVPSEWKQLELLSENGKNDH